MIQINVLGKEQLKLNLAVLAFHESQYNRSFSKRNPELGKMINCPVCSRRHRESIKCQQIFHNDEDGKPLVAAQTPRGMVGSDKFAKKRFHPHPNLRGLQLVQRTQALFLAYYSLVQPDPQKAMIAARTEAGRQLRQERLARIGKKRHQQDVSRRINRGRLAGGTK